jgi:hypothetical protein
VLQQGLRLSAALLRATHYAILGAEAGALRDFVQAVSSVPEVTEIVLFEDADGTHIWTAMANRKWDAETAVLRAHRALRKRCGQRVLDLFVAACPPKKLEERLPRGFVKLYGRT